MRVCAHVDAAGLLAVVECCTEILALKSVFAAVALSVCGRCGSPDEIFTTVQLFTAVWGRAVGYGENFSVATGVLCVCAVCD